jgi:DNA-directed RNA polymerase subunit RPC12/RpoP
MTIAPYICPHCGNQGAWLMRIGRERWVYKCTQCRRNLPIYPAPPA